jgi:hypothetical protein
MKRIFTLLLIIFNILSIQAQDELQDGMPLTKVYYQSFGMDSIPSGHLQNMKFERFQQHIQLSEDCMLSLPKDEYILKMNEQFVMTTQFLYGNPYQQKISSFTIKNCELQLIASSIFPYESEFYVSEKGEVIRSDFWEGYGKKLQFLDQNLEVKTTFEPFEEGFNELQILDKGEDWHLVLSATGSTSGNQLVTVDKATHSISKH